MGSRIGKFGGLNKVSSKGWICLHRSMLNWEWYGDPNMFAFFIHCLLKANYKDKKWQGKTIKRGQFWTSLPSLSSETGLTNQQVRTCIKKLKLTGEITDAGTSSGRMITVLNYNKYQDENTQANRQETDGQQTGNRQVTATNNINNINNKNNVNKKDALASLAEQLGVSVELIERIVKHRRDIKKPANTDKKISLVVSALTKCVQDGFFESLELAMDYLDNTEWKTLKPEYLNNMKKKTPYSTMSESQLCAEYEKRGWDSRGVRDRFQMIQRLEASA